MILTVTLNAALDITYHVETLRPGAAHRVHPTSRAGGKGVNVACVLQQLGEPVRALGFAGGRLRDDLPGFVPIAGESRRTVTVVSTEDGLATLFNEPGPTIGPGEWAALLAEFDRLAAQAKIVVLAGSLPAGLAPDSYAQLIRRSPAPVVLDADGVALRQGIAAGPALIKPNATELAGLGLDDPRALGIPVAATMGADGAAVYTAAGVWRATPPEALVGNATGAGDAFTAACARGLAAGHGWPDILQDAVAMSAAAVCVPVAGRVDDKAYARFRNLVTVWTD